MPNSPFKITINLLHGDSNGFRSVEKSNWIGYGVVCPKPEFPDVKSRSEFSKPGVYVLLGKTEEKTIIYIGEGDPVKQRLEQHFVKKDFWDKLFLFTSKDDTLDKTSIQFLEARLVQLAKEAKRCVLENANSPELPTLSESKLIEMKPFLEEMLLCFPVIGLNVFEKPTDITATMNTLFIKAKGIEARGYESSEGFVVLKGSQAVKEEVDSIHRYMSVLRGNLIDQKVFLADGDHYILTQNYTFESPSTAAGVIQGRTANGRVDWKDEKGRTLKEIQLENIGEPN